MKCIVTGGAGFIGSHLVERLVDLGNSVVVIDNLSTGVISNLKNVKSKITFIKEDITNWSIGSNKADFFFHLAALPRVGRSIDNPIETHDANVTATIHALEAAKKMNVKKFIYASSSSVYGMQERLPLTEDMSPNPLNPYAYQKWIGEIYSQMYNKVYGLPTISLRFFNVYGPRMSFEGAYKLVFAIWIEQKKQGKPLTIYGDGKQTRDFTHVYDIVSGLLKSMESNIECGVFNLGVGRQTTINYLATLFEHEVVHTPPRKFEEKLKEADTQKVSSQLDWAPQINIEEGVKQIRQYYGI